MKNKKQFQNKICKQTRSSFSGVSFFLNKKRKRSWGKKQISIFFYFVFFSFCIVFRFWIKILNMLLLIIHCNTEDQRFIYTYTTIYTSVQYSTLKPSRDEWRKCKSDVWIDDIKNLRKRFHTELTDYRIIVSSNSYCARWFE